MSTDVLQVCSTCGDTIGLSDEPVSLCRGCQILADHGVVSWGHNGEDGNYTRVRTSGIPQPSPELHRDDDDEDEEYEESQCQSCGCRTFNGTQRVYVSETRYYRSETYPGDVELCLGDADDTDYVDEEVSSTSIECSECGAPYHGDWTH